MMGNGTASRHVGELQFSHDMHATHDFGSLAMICVLVKWPQVYCPKERLQKVDIFRGVPQ